MIKAVKPRLNDIAFRTLVKAITRVRRRHGFEVEGAPDKFFSVPPPPQICVVPPPNSWGTAGAYHSGKTDIVKITRVNNKALLTWRLADIHDASQNTPPKI